MTKPKVTRKLTAILLPMWSAIAEGADTGPETQTYPAQELKGAWDHWGSIST